jgi:hypothetical protein
MTKAAKRGKRMASVGEKYVELLANEGYRPKIETDDESVDILFRSEGIQYRLALYHDDPEFFALSLCYGIDEQGVTLEQLLAIANDANERWKIAKVTLHPVGEAVRFQYEAFGQLAAEGLERAIGILRMTSNEFFKEVRSRAAPKAQA